MIDIESQQNEAASFFDKKWEAKELQEWDIEKRPETNGASMGIWCAACKEILSN